MSLMTLIQKACRNSIDEKCCNAIGQRSELHCLAVLIHIQGYTYITSFCLLCGNALCRGEEEEEGGGGFPEGVWGERKRSRGRAVRMQYALILQHDEHHSKKARQIVAASAPEYVQNGAMTVKGQTQLLQRCTCGDDTKTVCFSQLPAKHGSRQLCCRTFPSLLGLIVHF